MKQTNVYRATIVLLTGVLLIAAGITVNQQRRLNRLREYEQVMQKKFQDYENRHQRDQDTIAQLRHSDQLKEKWLDDTSWQMMEASHTTGYLRNGNGTVTFSK